MAKLAQLRAKAKSLGIPASEIRSASDADELQAVIDRHSGKGKPVAKKKAAKKIAKKATKSRTTRQDRKPARKSKPVPATSRKSGTAKRRATTQSDGGRNMLGKVNYSRTDGWNPRAGSPVDRIVKCLKKHKGDREKVFQELKKDIWSFVGKRMRDGSKRTKDSAEAMLRYRIARTDWDFAMRTGQHTASENRVEYGTGGTGSGSFKRGRKTATKAAPRKSASKKSAARKTTAKKSTARKAAGRKVNRKRATARR